MKSIDLIRRRITFVTDSFVHSVLKLNTKLTFLSAVKTRVGSAPSVRESVSVPDASDKIP